MSVEQDPIRWFRTASPYIYAHRNKTFVVSLDQDALRPSAFVSIARDLTLLHALGVRLVVVHANAGSLQVKTESETGYPVLTASNLGAYLEQTGGTTQRLLAQLSAGLPNAVSQSSDLVAVSGNFIKAQPLGILNGIDQEHDGIVRRVNHLEIVKSLDQQALVIVPPLGYSLSGETFGLDPTVLAGEIATALQADKLIYFIDQDRLIDDAGQAISELTGAALDPAQWPSLINVLTTAKKVVGSTAAKCHLIHPDHDGALLEELFTREGCGTQIVQTPSAQLRPAQLIDIHGILALIEPLEATGALVKRSRELIESELDRFWVIVQEGLIIGCGALYPFRHGAEIACLATDPLHRDLDHGDRLLKALIQSAKAQAIDKVFVLTTQTAHWFQERGFEATSVTDLPEDKQALYNWQRNAKVFFRTIS
jgi:amino-acid N-acetyltransferase